MTEQASLVRAKQPPCCAGTAIEGLTDDIAFTKNPANAKDPAKEAFKTYKRGGAVFRVALAVIVVVGLCYLAATWTWVAAPNRSFTSERAPNCHHRCHIKKTRHRSDHSEPCHNVCPGRG
jgi:cytochrome c-type biogenesis protein CcmH/NrfG